MRDRIEADEQHTYVSVDVPGFKSFDGRKVLTYHTYDDLDRGDEVLICGGVAEGRRGTVVNVNVKPPTVLRYSRSRPDTVPIYSYRVERVAEPDPLLLAEIDNLRNAVVNGEHQVAFNYTGRVRTALDEALRRPRPRVHSEGC